MYFVIKYYTNINTSIVQTQTDKLTVAKQLVDALNEIEKNDSIKYIITTEVCL